MGEGLKLEAELASVQLAVERGVAGEMVWSRA